MKKMMLIILLLVPFNLLIAQSIEIQDEVKKVAGNRIQGFSSKIKGNFENIRESWIKTVNDFKSRRIRNYILLNEVSFPEISVNTFKAYTTIDRIDSGAIIWIGFSKEIKEQDNAPELQNALFKFLYKFTFDYEKQKIQEDINNAERAAQFTSRKHQKLIQDLKNLELKLLDARNEKRKLEQKLEELELEVQVLMQKIEDNKQEQVEVYQDLEQIKKALEKHKERLKEIN